MTVARMFIGGVLVALLLVLSVVVWVDRARPITVTVTALAMQDIQVFVNGAIATPGVVSVPAGARLTDVADAAGGFTVDADYSRLNLAGRVGDGENIFIPSTNALDTDNDVGPARSQKSGVLDLNVATVAELDELPGIGEVLAGRIVDYREENGPFASVDDLVLVDGISSRIVDDIRPLVTVGDGS